MTPEELAELDKYAEYMFKHPGQPYPGLPNRRMPDPLIVLGAQNGCCKICKRNMLDATESGLRKWCIDHDHETGQFRGIICRACNLMLGFAKDNIDTLQAAIKYLYRAKHS